MTEKPSVPSRSQARRAAVLVALVAVLAALPAQPPVAAQAPLIIRMATLVPTAPPGT